MKKLLLALTLTALVLGSFQATTRSSYGQADEMVFLPLILRQYQEGGDTPNPPGSVVKLVFIHHSTGEAWLTDDNGDLGIALRDNNYFVSDTNYGWGPTCVELGGPIGDYTDIPHWYLWFTGSNRGTYLAALYAESGQNSAYSRLATNPGGENEIIMFKSCFPNSNIDGNPNDPPAPSADYNSELNVANAKRIYLDLLNYFATRQDKLFIVITAPPQVQNATDATQAANARAFNNWLVNDWLDNYPYNNVAVFDFYNVLTSNGGSNRINDPNTNDLGWPDGNHHRWWSGAIQHIKTVNNNFAAYGSDPWDSHPTQAGNLKATGEFVPLLNLYYNRWKQGGGAPPTQPPAPTEEALQPTPATKMAWPPSPTPAEAGLIDNFEGAYWVRLWRSR
ncbi:MAG: hypothetical protein ACUVV0_13145 [Anaerolineae bacterium]